MGILRTYTRFLINVKSRFGTSSKASKSHYDTLGITPKATQNDVKSAYYKLTMIYHPDKNKSEEAKQKFRAITDAYEILGDYKSRKMYDRGMRPNSRMVDTRTDEELRREEAQTRFYRARMQRSKVPTRDGRTPIYNFDEWARAHYGNLLEKKFNAKENYDRMQFEREASNIRAHNSQIIGSIIFCSIMIVSFIFSVYENSYDVDKLHSKRTKSEPP